MQVIVKLLSSQTSPKTSHKAQIQVTSEPLDIVSSLGLQMQPMHPDTEDSNLMSYYNVEVSDPQTANDLIQRLLQSECVDGAYIKPTDALP